MLNGINVKSAWNLTAYSLGYSVVPMRNVGTQILAKMSESRPKWIQETLAKEVRRVLRSWNAPKESITYTQCALSKALRTGNFPFWVGMALAHILRLDPWELVTGRSADAMAEWADIETTDLWAQTNEEQHEAVRVMLRQFRGVGTGAPKAPIQGHPRRSPISRQLRERDE